MVQSRELAARFEAYSDWRRRLSAAISTLHEWLADARGGALLGAMFADDPVMRSEGFIEVVGTMPMDTLAGFPGIAFTHAQLDDLIARL